MNPDWLRFVFVVIFQDPSHASNICLIHEMERFFSETTAQSLFFICVELLPQVQIVRD